MVRVIFFTIICFFSLANSYSQDLLCDPSTGEAHSQRLCNYVMDLVLDTDKKLVHGVQKIEWINNGDVEVNHLELYMYLNAFKDVHSSYISGSVNNVMGQDLSDRKLEMWGSIVINSIKQKGVSNELNKYYIQNLDNNEKDQTVLRVDLVDPVQPGDTLYLETEFVSKLPKTIARVGYAENNFHFFVHWYPKLGVYEQNPDGIWGWNCHQFLQRMEFYGEFGNYDVTITADPKFVVGGSGCRTQIVDHPNGLRSHHFEAFDVIDFAWTAYPDFVVYEDSFLGIDIELLSPDHHSALVPRLIGAVKNSIEFLDEHIGVYPYPKITVMDPPALGMRSGFMEYPTFITGGSFYGFPKGVKSLESLIIHEFCHQYFMGILATNEKEAPWLDEGFVTFLEDEIMESYYGKDNSLVNFMGYTVSNSAMSRNEYVSLKNKRSSHITNKSWLIKGDYKGIVYAKTATVLQSLKRIMGEESFYDFLSQYFNTYKFTHPNKEDFMGTLNGYLRMNFGSGMSEKINSLLEQALDKTAICDFSTSPIRYNDSNSDSVYSSVVIEQLGDFVAPVEIVFQFEDDSKLLKEWDGKGGSKEFTFITNSRLRSVQVDPERKIFFDIDFNNNSYTSTPAKSGLFKYAGRALFWTQNIFQSLSFLM